MMPKHKRCKGFKPGPMGIRALGQLSYDKGMRISTASQADNVALESSLIRQGLLTYAFIHDKLEATQAVLSHGSEYPAFGLAALRRTESTVLVR